MAPKILHDRCGTLVYAGGDDVLALLPVGTALEAALALRNEFSTKEVMGEKATLSAGLAIVHHKEDLRQALDAARAAEKRAKEGGRNQLGVAILRHSGEQAGFRLGWDQVEDLDNLRNRFAEGMTDRWAYQLRAEAPAFDGLAPEMTMAELCRLLRRRIGDGTVTEADVNTLSTLFGNYIRWLATSTTPATDVAVLAQSASFLARGRDR